MNKVTKVWNVTLASRQAHAVEHNSKSPDLVYVGCVPHGVVFLLLKKLTWSCGRHKWRIVLWTEVNSPPRSKKSSQFTFGTRCEHKLVWNWEAHFILESFIAETPLPKSLLTTTNFNAIRMFHNFCASFPSQREVVVNTQVFFISTFCDSVQHTALTQPN